MRPLFRNLEALNPRPLTQLAGQLSALVAGRLWLKVLLGKFLGLASSENVEQLRRLGLIAVSFFVAMTAVAVSIALWIATLVRPGNGRSRRSPSSA